jgi:hypothetical protein
MVANGGCSCRPATAPVSGQITLEGRPIGPGTISFLPDKSKGTEGLAATGKFGPDGKYALTTYEEGDGAVVGHHRVQIESRPEGADAGDEAAASQPGTIPLRYAADSGLTAEVPPEGNNALNFDLKPD